MAGSSNTLRSVLKELGWSRTRLVAELRRQAASSGETLPGTESLLAMVSRWVNNHQQPSDFYRDLLARTLGRPRAELFSDETTRWSWRPRPSRGCWLGRWRPPQSARPPWRRWRRRWGSSPARTRVRLPAPDRSAAAGNGSGPPRDSRARVRELVAHERATGTRLAARDVAAAAGISERRAYELLRAVRAEGEQP